METDVEFRKCPKCSALIAVALEKGNSRCGKCWEGAFETGDKPDGGGE